MAAPNEERLSTALDLMPDPPGRPVRRRAPLTPAACKAACKVHLEWVAPTHPHPLAEAGAAEDTSQKLGPGLYGTSAKNVEVGSGTPL